MIFKLDKNQSLTKLSDEQLIAEYKITGETAYAGELYNRYVHLVYGICLKYVKNKEESKDLAMIIFEKMLAHLPATEVQMFKKWLYTIAKNQCLTYLRDQHKKVDHPADAQELEKKSKTFMENGSFSSPINEEPAENKIQAALAQLKPDQKRCVEMFFYKNMSYKEIEQQTEYSIKQIKSFLQNGKRKLKIILESKGFGSGQ